MAEVVTGSGCHVTCQATVASVNRNACAIVSRLAGQGFWTVFGPGQAFITPCAVAKVAAKPENAEDLSKDGGLWYLRLLSDYRHRTLGSTRRQCMQQQVAVAGMQAPAAQTLPVPGTPTSEQISLREVTHCPLQIAHCVAGRAHGEPHGRNGVEDRNPLKRTVHIGMVAELGKQYVLSLLHCSSGFVVAAKWHKQSPEKAETPTQKNWQFVSYAESSKAFASAVLARLRTHGLKASPDFTLKAQHQSVGQAERVHQSIGAFHSFAH
eukprot:4573892-Amphidinium_carterae.1